MSAIGKFIPKSGAECRTAFFAFCVIVIDTLLGIYCCAGSMNSASRANPSFK